MPGFWAFEVQLPCQKYQIPPIVVRLMSHIICVIFWLCWLVVCWGPPFISLCSFTTVLQLRSCQFGCPRNPLLHLENLIASVDQPGIAYNHSFLVLVLGSMGSRPWFFHVGSGLGTAAFLSWFSPSTICAACCMSRIVSGVWSRGDGGVIGAPSGLVSIGVVGSSP